MPDIHLRYALEIPKICLRYASDRPKTCLRYALKMVTHSVNYEYNTYWESHCFAAKLDAQ